MTRHVSAFFAILRLQTQSRSYQMTKQVKYNIRNALHTFAMPEMLCRMR